MSIETEDERPWAGRAAGGDGWTVRTADGALAAHAEHTIAVTPGAPPVLSR